MRFHNPHGTSVRISGSVGIVVPRLTGYRITAFRASMRRGWSICQWRLYEFVQKPRLRGQFAFGGRSLWHAAEALVGLSRTSKYLISKASSGGSRGPARTIGFGENFVDYHFLKNPAEFAKLQKQLASTSRRFIPTLFRQGACATINSEVPPRNRVPARPCSGRSRLRIAVLFGGNCLSGCA